MRLWLDDIRNPPMEMDMQGAYYDPDNWVWVKNADQAIGLLKTGQVTHIALDHDLGDGNGTGYDVACFIEACAAMGEIPRLQWSIHSSNPVGRANMTRALLRAEVYWDG